LDSGFALSDAAEAGMSEDEREASSWRWLKTRRAAI
jgi:hypothetical protein